MAEGVVGAVAVSYLLFFLFIEAFIIAIHVVVAKRFKRGAWKWGILGFFFGVFSFIWLIALGKQAD